VPYEPEAFETEAVDQAVTGADESEQIPEAKYAGEAQPLPTTEERG
jgi:hypothetical protein